MYVSLHFPFAPQYFPQKKRGFSSVFAKRTSKNIEFFQIFGKRMQEAQASKKAESSLGPLFCDTGSPKTTLSGTSSNCRAVRGGPPPPQKKKNDVIDVGRGGVRGGYPLSSSKYPTRRAMSADKGYPPYENGKGKGGHDKGKSKTFAAIAEKTEEQPAIQQTAPSTEPTYAGWTDQDWDQSWTWNEQGWY